MCELPRIGETPAQLAAMSEEGEHGDCQEPFVEEEASINIPFISFHFVFSDWPQQHGNKQSA